MRTTVTLARLSESLGLKTWVPGNDFEKKRIQNVVASDLMSDVLVVAQDDVLLVTSLASDQMIRTADLVGAAGVVLVNGKHPPASLLALATELGMTLLRSSLPKYETCLAIGAALAAAAKDPS